MIVCIGRQFGSGGLKIGEMLAKRLNAEFYDKSLIIEAAKESGIHSECFEKVDEKASFFRGGADFLGLRIPFVSDGGLNPLSGDNLFMVMSETIRQLADKHENVIFVGRCADYILRDRADLVSVFITADEKDRIERIVNRNESDGKNAHDIMHKKDRQRSEYYDYYTGRKWGYAASYDLTVNSSRLGIDKTVDYILSFITETK